MHFYYFLSLNVHLCKLVLEKTLKCFRQFKLSFLKLAPPPPHTLLKKFLVTHVCSRQTKMRILKKHYGTFYVFPFSLSS